MQNIAQSDNIERWIRALLSGEYTQEKFTLYTSDKNVCALGLAVKLFHPQHKDSYWPGNQWFRDTFGGRINPARIGDFNDRGWTFADLAAYLISYLPSNSTKYELQTQVKKALSRQAAVRQEDARENATSFWSRMLKSR